MAVWCAAGEWGGGSLPNMWCPLPQGSTNLLHAYGLKYSETYITEMKKFIFFLILNVLAAQRPKSLG